MSKPDMADEVYPEYKHLRSRMALCHEIKNARDAQQIAVTELARVNADFAANQRAKSDFDTVLESTIDTLATRLGQVRGELHYVKRELERLKRKHPTS